MTDARHRTRLGAEAAPLRTVALLFLVACVAHGGADPRDDTATSVRDTAAASTILTGSLTATLATATTDGAWNTRPCEGPVYLAVADDGAVTGTADCADDTNLGGSPALGTVRGTLVDGTFSGTWSYVFWGDYGADAALAAGMVDGALVGTADDTAGDWWRFTDGAFHAAP